MNLEHYKYFSGYFTDLELQKLGFRSIGRKVSIARNALIVGFSNVRIGDNVRIDSFASLIAEKGDLVIGNNVHISIGSHLVAGGGIEIKDFAGISANTIVLSSTDDFSGDYLTNPTIHSSFTNVDSKKIVIEKHVVIGANSVILPGAFLSEGVVVGANSLVKTKLEPFCIYAGSPVKKIKNRSRKIVQLEADFKSLY